MGFSDNRNEPTDFEVTCVRGSDHAILFDYEGDEVWIPKSLILDTDPEDYNPGDDITISIPRWKAEEIGWE